MFNQAIIIGNITADLELKYLPSGTATTGFNVAVNHKYKSGEEMKEETSFITVSVFGKTAENCSQYLRKGSKVLVVGRLKQERWEGKDGSKHDRIKIIADKVQFLDFKKADGSKEGKPPAETEEEIPF